MSLTEINDAVVVMLKGGLGNQLFQWAAGNHLAARLGKPLYLDLGFYPQQSLRRVEISTWGARFREAPRELVERFTWRWRPRWWRGVRKKLLRQRPPLGERMHLQRGVTRDPSFASLTAPVYLEGYWSCSEYWAGLERVVCDPHLERRHYSLEAERLEEEIAGSESVCVHIRRGDYAKDAATQQAHGLLSLDYYRDSMERLAEKYSGLRFFVFTDDLAWCAEHTREWPAAKLVDSCSAESTCVDLALMRLGKHFVLANSSYSWWGACLSTRGGEVYAPRRWFASDRYGDPQTLLDEMLPPAWQRI